MFHGPPPRQSEDRLCVPVEFSFAVLAGEPLGSALGPDQTNASEARRVYQVARSLFTRNAVALFARVTRQHTIEITGDRLLLTRRREVSTDDYR